MADEEAKTLRFWFRQHYRLAPTDRRYQEMTEEGLRLEYEAVLAYGGEPLKTCPRCSVETHERACPRCVLADGRVLALTGDEAMDDALARIEDGEEIDLEKALRGGFEPVKVGA